MTQKARKYQLTFNNPKEKGFTHEVIKSNIFQLKGVTYWCMADEIGENGTPHTHLYFYSPNAILFSTVQQLFYGAHIEPAKGSHQDNRDYIRKEGKWLNNKKHGTKVDGTFEESGELPPERAKAQTVSEDIYNMITDGASNAEILRQYPGAMNRLQHINAARQTVLGEQFRTQWRDLDTTYLYGPPGVGKTRFVMERFGYENVYRVTNYTHPFDGYRGQDVILFDEFRDSLPLADMLNYLDGYPLMLPCRYADAVACYTKVFIISNIPLGHQYRDVQLHEPESYAALLRRVPKCFEMLPESNGLPF